MQDEVGVRYPQRLNWFQKSCNTKLIRLTFLNLKFMTSQDFWILLISQAVSIKFNINDTVYVFLLVVLLLSLSFRNIFL